MYLDLDKKCEIQIIYIKIKDKHAYVPRHRYTHFYFPGTIQNNWKVLCKNQISPRFSWIFYDMEKIVFIFYF